MTKSTFAVITADQVTTHHDTWVEAEAHLEAAISRKRKLSTKQWMEVESVIWTIERDRERGSITLENGVWYGGRGFLRIELTHLTVEQALKVANAAVAAAPATLD